MFWFWKTWRTGQGHESSSFVCRKDRHYFSFLSQRDKMNSCKMTSTNKHLVGDFLPTTKTKAHWASHSSQWNLQLAGIFICAKQHKVVTDVWAIPVKFLLRWINFKDSTESWKCIKISNNGRNWLRSTITLLLSTMGWDNSRNAK